MPSLVIIHAAATRLRLALEQLPPEQCRSLWGGIFPRGACGDVSLILGAYFKDIGIQGFKYIYGWRVDKTSGNRISHGWLARGTLCVDITADQFDDAPVGSVFVSESSLWHSGFELDVPGEADFRDCHTPILVELHKIYGLLEQHLVFEKCATEYVDCARIAPSSTG
jgi:hypothetical protein